jgi:hypothetical protein
MMTKKDFKELANFMAESFDENDSAVKWMEEFCYRNNPRFDETRFREWIRRVRADESLKGLR